MITYLCMYVYYGYPVHLSVLPSLWVSVWACVHACVYVYIAIYVGHSPDAFSKTSAHLY